MESTIEKLNQNRLMELDEQDFENILNNTELFTLLVQKVQEGQEINTEYAYILEEKLVSPEYVTIFLDLIKKQSPEEFVNIFFDSEETIKSQFPEETVPIVIEYLKANADEVLEQLKTSEQLYAKIEKNTTIKYILDNKLEQHYGSIYMSPITKEFEDLFIAALERNTYKKIYTITPAILSKCKETNNLSAAAYQVSGNNPEENEIILSALTDDFSLYNNLSHNFIELNKSDLRIFRGRLRSNSFIHIEEDEFTNPKLREIIKEEIERNHKLADEWSIYNHSSIYPEIVLAVIKYCNIDTLNSILRYNTKVISETLTTNPKELIESLIYNLEHNQDKIEELFKELTSSYSGISEEIRIILQDPTFFKYIIPKINIEIVLHSFINYEYSNGESRYYLKEEIYSLFEETNITIANIPNNFNYTVNYPDNIWLGIIPLLDEKQLTPNNIKLEKFIERPKVFDCILNRLKELKSNSYNSSLEYWQGTITDTLIEIVCSPENPLNLNTTQKLRILPASKMTNSNHIYEIINQIETIDYQTFQVILTTLSSIKDLNELKKIWSIIFPKLELNLSTIKSLASRCADIYGTLQQTKEGEKPNIDDTFIIFYECLGEYLKTQKEIPLILTRYFDEEIINIATYSSTECLVSNPSLFLIDGIQPAHFIKYIKKSKEQHLPIDLKLLHAAKETTVSLELYKYDNITYSDDAKTYSILLELLNNAPVGSIQRNIVDNWVNTHLTYKFFDCQTEGNKNNFLEMLLLEQEYTEKILEEINTSKITDGVVLSTHLLELLLIDQKNEEIKQKAFDTIIKLIEDNKINNYVPDYRLEALLEYVTHPSFVKYIKETCISKIGNYLSYIQHFLENDTYREYTFHILKENSHLATNNHILSLIKKDKDLKEYVRTNLENNNNSWLDFHENYLEPDLLKAYLKNHSIDKVVTFIVHNQNLSLITPELNEIFKEALLTQHQEYNKESYEILEQFYGLELLLLLETNNLIVLLQKNPETVKKFIEVFKERKLDEGIITSISDSFRQNYFNIENVHIINFYTNTLEKIQRGITDEEIEEVISTIIQYLPSNLEEDIIATNNELLLNTYKTNHYEFLKLLIQELINNQNIYSPLFNKITTYLIVQKRNEYRSKQNIYKDTNLKYELETKSLHNTLFNYLAKNQPQELIDIIEFTDFDTDINWKTIYFLSGQTQHFSKEELPAIKRNIPEFKNIILFAFSQMNQKDNNSNRYSYSSYSYELRTPKKFENLPRRYEYLLDDENFMKTVKIIPIYPEKKKPSETIGNINLETFELLTKEPEKYQALIALLNKYRFLEWGNLFQPTVEKLSLGEDEINIYNFINAFSKIYDNEKKIILRERKKLIASVVEEMKAAGKPQSDIDDYIRVKENEPININITAYKVLKYSTIYSSIANYYKIILGMEDFDLVKRNDGPNSSYRSAEERLQRASEMQIKMMQFNEITIPSFIYDHKTENESKLRVTVGNRASSRNLTHGERTGACMRAHGHADSLFEFCNLDPRGFHIVFTDPETNEYVSRISGFRNGNTVFLNQLRFSTSSKYSTQDVIDACKAIANEIIERSKDSEMPIDNVVASPTYALCNQTTQQVSHYNNIGDGVYQGYRDVSNYAVVLATTGENGKVVPLKPDGENQPVYEAVRLQPIEYTHEQINDSIKTSLQRITAIKRCLENQDNPEYYKIFDFDYEILETTYIHVIIGQDWFVALDANGNLTHDIAVQNEHSIEELNNALAKMNQIKEAKQKIGGFTNGIQ